MISIAERLRSHWLDQNLDLPPGVPEERLQEFEVRSGVTLPPDLRDYFLVVDGMGTRDQFDDDFFCFWPLGELVRVSDEYEDDFIEDQSSFFVFADHSICLPSFAIRLDSIGSCHTIVIAIVFNQVSYHTSVVANSFSEFASRYLADEESRFGLTVGLPRRTETEDDSGTRHDRSD